MKDWQIIPEIVGRDATLRMAAMQAVDAVDQGRHLVVEGEAGSGRRLLARSAWFRRSPGTRSLFTLDCRIFRGDAADSLLLGGGQFGKLNLAKGGGLLLLHSETLPRETQRRLAVSLVQNRSAAAAGSTQLLLTCAPSPDAVSGLDPDLASLLLRVRVPALRERVGDIRAIAESFLRSTAPFARVRCSQALVDRFCSYDWPGNITELHSVLRRLLVEPHNGLLDVRHLADLMHRDMSCFGLGHGSCDHGPAHIEGGFIQRSSMSGSRNLQ